MRPSAEGSDVAIWGAALASSGSPQQTFSSSMPYAPSTHGLVFRIRDIRIPSLGGYGWARLYLNQFSMCQLLSGGATITKVAI